MFKTWIARVNPFVGISSVLQAASTVIAIPFSIIFILMMFGLGKALWQAELSRNDVK